MGFFRYWLPNFAITAKPLYQAVTIPGSQRDPPHGAPHPLSHSPQSLLFTAGCPALALRDSTRPYYLLTDERMGVAPRCFSSTCHRLNLPSGHRLSSKQLDSHLIWMVAMFESPNISRTCPSSSQDHLGPAYHGILHPSLLRPSESFLSFPPRALISPSLSSPVSRKLPNYLDLQSCPKP